MFDDKTANFAIPLPHQQNTLEEDVHRLRAALTAIDASLQSLEARLQQRGAANGLASLDANGRLPAAELTVHQHAMAELSDLATWKADAVAPNTNAPDPNNVKYGVMLVFRVGDIVAQVVMSMGLAQGNLYLRCWAVGNTPPAWSKLTPSP